MLDRIASVLTVALMVAVLFLFEAGRIAPRDAFFIATSVVIVFTGQLIIAREQMGLLEAIMSIVARPNSYGSRTTLASYVACLVLGVLVTAQVLASA